MTINFPNTPNVNDTYTDANGVVWYWNGHAWRVRTSSLNLALAGQQPYIDVRDYGAVDGGDASTNTSAIQAAADAAVASDKPLLISGDFSIDDEISIVGNIFGLRIIGYGRGVSVLRAPSGFAGTSILKVAGTAVSSTPLTHLTVENLSFVVGAGDFGADIGSDVVGLDLTYVHDAVIKNCGFYFCASGVKAVACSDAAMNSCLFQKCGSSIADLAALHLADDGIVASNNWIIAQNHIQGSRWWGLIFDGCTDSIVVANKFEQPSSGTPVERGHIDIRSGNQLIVSSNRIGRCINTAAANDVAVVRVDVGEDITIASNLVLNATDIHAFWLTANSANVLVKEDNFCALGGTATLGQDLGTANYLGALSMNASRRQGIERDTGWRDIASLTENGWTAVKMQIRRTGNVVHMRIATLNPSAATATTFYTLPIGFTGKNNELDYMGLRLSGTTTQWAWVEGDLCACNTTMSGNASGSWTWTTNDAWPTTLPGVAS